MKNIIVIIIPILFFIITIKQIKYIKNLIIPIKKRNIEIFIVLLSVIIFMVITYVYAYTFMHYLTCTLGILMFISMWLKQGITSKGFISMYRYKEVILWNEIKKVKITCSNDITIKLSGNFNSQTFYFNKCEYDKIIDLFKNNLSEKVQLETV